MKTTYVLFVPGTRAPSVKHNSLATARTEARRLIEQEKCPKVMICRFIEGIEAITSIEPMKENPLPNRDEIF